MSFSMNLLLLSIRKKFADIQHVSTDTLYSWLYPIRRDNLLVYDTRPAEEYNISHLSTAIRVDPELSPEQLRQTLYKTLPVGEDKTTIACYCSVGYRSSTVARQLNQIHSKDLPEFEAVNVNGSLFKWANEAKPMVDSAGAETKFCHPYNKVFGQLLNREYWKFPDKKY